MTRPPLFSPEIADLRWKEQQRRYQRARRKALAILVEQYRDEYRDLMQWFTDDVNLAAGPLPGDEVLSK